MTVGGFPWPGSEALVYLLICNGCGCAARRTTWDRDRVREVNARDGWATGRWQEGMKSMPTDAPVDVCPKCVETFKVKVSS